MASRGPGPLPSAGASTELDRVRAIVSSYFPVYETRLGPQSVLLAVHIDPPTLESKFDGLRRELWALKYVPILRRQSGEEFIEVVRRPKAGPARIWINLLLLAGTIATTSFAGSLLWLSYVGGNSLTWSDFGWGALSFGLPVMTILGLHELAHYVVARHHHVEASLPYFMPVPPPFLLGTFGAFISIREPFPNKKVLFDIGAAGPVAGFLVSIPITIAGFYLSAHAPVLPLSYCGPTILGVSYGNLLVGTPLFWFVLKLFVPGSIISLSPLALAGWVGILVTAINLLPASQLDGGHVFRALLGERSRFLSYGVILLLLGIGVYFYFGWFLYGILLIFLGVRHPPPLNDSTPLDVKRYLVGVGVVAILITGFVLVPLAAPPGEVTLDRGAFTRLSAPPGAAIAGNLSVEVTNGDPVPHGFLFTGAVANVSVGVGNSTEYLTGAALTSWAENSTWVFHLPGNGSVTLTGANPTLPSADFVSIDANAATTIVVTFSNTETASVAVLDLATSEFCATSGGGSASASITGVWP